MSKEKILGYGSRKHSGSFLVDDSQRPPPLPSKSVKKIFVPKHFLDDLEQKKIFFLPLDKKTWSFFRDGLNPAHSSEVRPRRVRQKKLPRRVSM